jgi:hypothetical protein
MDDRGFLYFIFSLLEKKKERIPILFAVVVVVQSCGLLFTWLALDQLRFWLTLLRSLLFVYAHGFVCVNCRYRKEGEKKKRNQKKKRGFILIECLYYIQFIFGGWRKALPSSLSLVFSHLIVLLRVYEWIESFYLFFFLSYIPPCVCVSSCSSSLLDRGLKSRV